MSDGELRQLVRKHAPQLHWQAIESGSTASGIPDLNYAAEGGIEGWVECKTTDGRRVTIRPMQIGWCERRLRFNPRVFCMVRQKRDTLWLFHASKLRELSEQRLDAVEPLGQWSGGPARWGWDQIARWLVSG